MTGHSTRLPAGIRRRGNRFQARWRTPAGQARAETFATLDEAQARLLAVRQAMRSGTYRDPGAANITVGQWAPRWRSTLHGRPSSLARDDSYLVNHVLPRWAESRIGSITTFAIQEWVGELSTSGLAPATVQKIAQILSRILASAVADGRLPTNPFHGVKLPVVVQREARFLDPDELHRLEMAMPDAWALVIPFLADTGLRIGELAGLQVRDLDLPSRSVAVRRNAVEVRGQIVIGEPKTASGRRIVPTLTDEVAARVRDRVAHLRLEPTDHLFAGPSGGVLRAGAFRARVWAPAVASAQLTRPLPTPHSLRHSAIALWIAAGVSDPYRLARWAGHRQVSTIYLIYGHLLPYDASQERAALSAMRAAAISSY